MLKEKIPYLERQAPVHGGEFPSSQVPSLEPTACMPLALRSPPRPLPPKGHLFTHYLYTDDINMPPASVRHKNDCHTRLKQTKSGLASESIMRRRTSENKKVLPCLQFFS
jgi:hypothetical protein